MKLFDNLEKWEAMARPPADALREIKGGRMSGKTDISPQWRYKAMTEQYGPCGVGWHFTVARDWTMPAPDGQVAVFVQVDVYVRTVAMDAEGKMSEAWSQPIPGIGGNMLVAKEKSGLYVNDEAYKMALTDALSVALKMLGVAADVYAGKWDGSKYKDTPPAPTTSSNKPKPKPEPAPAAPDAEARLKVEGTFGALGINRSDLEKYLVKPIAEWTADDISRLRVIYANHMQDPITMAAIIKQEAAA